MGREVAGYSDRNPGFRWHKGAHDGWTLFESPPFRQMVFSIIFFTHPICKSAMALQSEGVSNNGIGGAFPHNSASFTSACCRFLIACFRFLENCCGFLNVGSGFALAGEQRRYTCTDIRRAAADLWMSRFNRYRPAMKSRPSAVEKRAHVFEIQRSALGGTSPATCAFHGYKTIKQTGDV